MKSFRMTPLLVAIIGTVLTALSCGGIVYFLNKPSSEALAAAQARYDAAKGEADPIVQAKAKKDLADAKVKVGQVQQQWVRTQAALMPPFDVSNRELAWRQLTYELTEHLGPSLLNWIPHTGVTLKSSITMPAPPTSPNAITASPLIVPIGGGTVTVQGSFRNILSHFQKWNDYNRLVLVDGLSLTGNSPDMQGTYKGEIIIFPQNPDKIDKPNPAAGSGGSGGPSLGGPGGSPGMPPGGMRPPGGGP